MALDKQQVEAVVACEDAQLVLASAGSGKTMSLLAKIEYLCDELEISPGQILAISFTKKTVDELIERCSIKGVEFRTFHALGNGILLEYQSEHLAKRRLISESEIAVFLRDKLLELCSDEAFARKVNDYILFYLSAPIAPGGYKNLSQKISINRLCLRASIRRQLYEESSKRAGSSLRGELIRNKEEELVANWLYINQINYEYRKEREGHRPDFTLDRCFLDIFSLDRNGNSLLGSQYQREVVWRRKYYRRRELRHIELQSWQ
jgi:DNA helicase-4